MTSPSGKLVDIAESRQSDIPYWPSRRHTELELAQKYGIDPVPTHSSQLDRSEGIYSDKTGANHSQPKSKNLIGDYMSFKPQPNDNKENIRRNENRTPAPDEKSTNSNRPFGSQSAFLSKHRKPDKAPSPIPGDDESTQLNPFLLQQDDSGNNKTLSRSRSLLQKDVPPVEAEADGEKQRLAVKAEREGRTFDVRRRRVLTDVLSKVDHFRTNGVSRQRTREYLLKRYRDKLHYPFAAERDILTLQVLIEVLYEELDTQLKTNEKDRLWVEMHKSDVNNLSDKDKTMKIQELQKEIRGLEEQIRQMRIENEQASQEARKKAWLEAETKQITQDKEILHLQTIISRLRGDRDLFDKYWDTLCLLFTDLDEWILQQAVELDDHRLDPLRQRIQRAGQFARWAKDYTLSGDERKFFEDREWIRRQELEKKEWALIMEFKDLGPRMPATPQLPNVSEKNYKPHPGPAVTLLLPTRPQQEPPTSTPPMIPPLRLQPSYSPHSHNHTSMSPPRTQNPARGDRTNSDSPNQNIRSLVSSPGSSKMRPSIDHREPRTKQTIATVEFANSNSRMQTKPKSNKPQEHQAAEPIYHSLVSAASAEEFSLRMGALSRDDLLKLCGELGDTIHMLRLERGRLCDKLFEAIEKLKARLFDCCAILEAMGKISSGRLGEFWAKRGVELVNDLLSGVAMSREPKSATNQMNRKEPLSAFKVSTPLKSELSGQDPTTPSPNSKLPTDIFDYGEAIANAEWVRELLGLQQASPRSLSRQKTELEHHRASDQDKMESNKQSPDKPVRVADVRLTSGKKSVAVEDRQVNLLFRLESNQKPAIRSASEEHNWTRHPGGSPNNKREVREEMANRNRESPLRSQLELLLIENTSLKASLERLKRLVDGRVAGHSPTVRGQSREARERASFAPLIQQEGLQLLVAQAVVIEKLLSQVA